MGTRQTKKGHRKILAFDVKDTRQKSKKTWSEYPELFIADVYEARQ